MIFDGHKRAERIQEELQKRVGTSATKLVVISVGALPVSLRYINRKIAFGERIGVNVVHTALSESISDEELLDAIREIQDNRAVQGIIVQLPLPSHIDRDRILDSIDPMKDADALGNRALVLAPVVCAIQDVIETNDIHLDGNIVVVGEGKLVGAPVIEWLSGAVTDTGDVSVLNQESKDIASILKDADIIITGVGVPHLITPDMIKTGVVIIDVGTSEAEGKLLGDASPECKEKSILFTPVPGGIGPLTVVFLFKNLLDLRDKQKSL